MNFIFSQSEQYVILKNKKSDYCYLAISSFGHTSHELDGLYLYYGCKHSQVETDKEGRLIIDGVDMI